LPGQPGSAHGKPALARNQEIHFLKNMAMMGGFLYLAAFGGGKPHEHCSGKFSGASLRVS
jgi:hypothetical protein